MSHFGRTLECSTGGGRRPGVHHPRRYAARRRTLEVREATNAERMALDINPEELGLMVHDGKTVPMQVHERMVRSQVELISADGSRARIVARTRESRTCDHAVPDELRRLGRVLPRRRATTDPAGGDPGSRLLAAEAQGRLQQVGSGNESMVRVL